jgi:hypothetical protein
MSGTAGYPPARGQPHLDSVHAAWQSGEVDPVETALNEWLGHGDPPPVEYWVQRVYADACFERGTLAQSVRAAEQAARQVGDEIALARIAASVIDALYSDWLPSREAQRWLDVLRSVAYARLLALPLSCRLEIAAGILAADLFGEALSTAAQVAESVATWVTDGGGVAATVRGNALGYALEYFSGQRRWQSARELVDAIDHLQMEPGFGPVARARVAARRGFYYHYRRGDYAGALAQSGAAVSHAAHAGIARPGREAGITVTLCHLMRGELAAATHALSIEEAAIPPGHLMLRANVHYERSWLHALRRDVVTAQRELDTACRLFSEVDEHGVMSLATPSLQAQLLLQVGEFDAALNVFEMRTRRPDAWLVDMALIEAVRGLDRGDRASALDALRRGLAAAARIDIKGCLWACRNELGQLLRLAVSENIESDWVRSAADARLLALD